MLGLPLQVRDQMTVHAIQTPVFSFSKEGQGGGIGKVMASIFWDATGTVFTERPNY